jgi:uncharacterized protein YprB with RNaseH-like and TPR domain
MGVTFDKFARISALRPATKCARLTSAVTGVSAAPSPREGEAVLASLLGGALDRNHFGEHFVVRRWHATPEPCPPLNGALTLLDPRAPRLAADPARWLFLDTETTGLAGGTGTYAFLVGLAWWDSAGLQLEQFFLRDFTDEHSMLTALSARLAERPVLVTFNGKSFDWPLLETRYRMTRSIRVPEPAAHLDLLHPARQIWRLRLGSVRLADLERRVLGAPSSLADWDRSHDLRSEMIPHIYFDYLRGGPIAPLLDVFRHNQMDLRGLAAIAVRMAALLDAPESADAPPLDLYGLSRLLRRRARPATRDRHSNHPTHATAHACHPESAACPERSRRAADEGSAFPAQVPISSSAPSATSAVQEFAARQLCERALASGLPAGVNRAALRDLAALAKRQRDFPRACSLWLQLAGIAAVSDVGASSSWPTLECGSEAAALLTPAHSPRATRGHAQGSAPLFTAEEADSPETKMRMGETMSSSAPALSGAQRREGPSALKAFASPNPAPNGAGLDAIHACIELAIHYEHRARDPHRSLHFARLALDALRPASRAALLTPANAARLRAQLDRRLARLQRKLSESSAPLRELSASASSLPLSNAAPRIPRTPLRRASKRPLSESNGHAQSPGR